LFFTCFRFTMKKVASLRDGVIFKKALSQPPIFTAFAQDFLGISLFPNSYLGTS